MKRLCAVLLAFLLLCAALPAALAQGADIRADWMPNEVKEFFSAAQFDGWTIGASASYLIENTVGGTFFFAVAQKEGHNVLYGFEQKNGHFHYWLRTDNAIPQGEGGFIVNYSAGQTQFASGAAVTFGEGMTIIFYRIDDEEQADTVLIAEVSKAGQFHLRAVLFNHAWDEAFVTPDSITYHLDEGHTVGTVYGVVETNLRYFSLSAFPRTIKEAREKLTNPPAIPAGNLTAQRIKFTGGQKFPVYSGPGMEYERAAHGKASVSTNDWIQVFGSENGYILIQYDISSSQMRFGYIPQSALPKSASVSPLQLEWADATIASATFLTDDPLNSQSRTRSLSQGQSVKWLAAMGNWVYVEVTGQGQPIRGFVPAGAVSKTAARQTYSASFQNAEYTAQAAVEVIYGSAANALVTVTGPDAWFQTGADAITGYQMYANNVPVAALSTGEMKTAGGGWQCVFTIGASLPVQTAVLGLCPIHALTGQKAEEMLVLSLR